MIKHLKFTKIILLPALFISISGAMSQAQIGKNSPKGKGIHFETGLSWVEIQQKAKIEHKYIFIDCFATWCGPCKLMDNDVYPNDSLGKYMNEHFLSVKVQMDTSNRDNQQVQRWYRDAYAFMQNYRIDGYPTFLFFSPDGELVHRETGYLVVNDFISLVMTATSPEKQYNNLMHRYNDGNLDSRGIKLLAQSAMQLGYNDIARKFSLQFINNLTYNEFFTKENLLFVEQFTAGTNDRGFVLFSNYPGKVDDILGEKASADFQYKVIGKEILERLHDKSITPDYVKIENDMGTKFGAIGKRAAYEALALYAGQKDDVNEFVKYEDKIHSNWPEDNSFFKMNNYAWWVFERTDDKNDLKRALSWQKKVIEGENLALNIDTYANLLYKLGRKQQAIKWEEKALKMEENDAVKQNRSPGESYRKTMAKMENNEPTWEIGLSYFEKLARRESISQADLELCSEHIKSINDCGFVILAIHIDQLADSKNKTDLCNILTEMLFTEIIAPKIYGDKTDWSEIALALKPYGAIGSQALMKAKVDDDLLCQDWKAYSTDAKRYLDVYSDRITDNEKQIFQSELKSQTDK